MIGSLIGTVASRHRNIDLSSDYFTTTWDASSGSIALPVVSAIPYNFDYRINGGAWTNYNQTPTINHELVISGLSGSVILDINPINNGLTEWKFNNGGDKAKLLSINNWGVQEISDTRWISAFYGCNNVQLNATDYPKFTGGIVNLTNFFRSCISLTNSISGWDMTGVINADGLFRSTSYNAALPVMNDCVSYAVFVNGNSLFNQPLDFITNAPTTLSGAFVNCSSFDQSLAGIDVSSLTNGTNMLNNVAISTSNYDATLISWAAQSVQSGVTVSFGNSQYTLGGAAEAARNTLTNAPNNWVITDGGGV